MNQLLRLALSAILLSSPIFLAAQEVSPVEATLIIPDRRVLPGVPLEMWVEVTNKTDSAVAVGLFPTLLVKKDGGEPFEIIPQGKTGNFPVLWGGHEKPQGFLELAPGRAEVLTFPIGEYLRGAEFFEDYRIDGPGHYEFALRLSKAPKAPANSVPLTFRGAATTREVSVERYEPQGSDAKVWQRMQLLGHGKWAVLSPFLTEDGGKMFDIWPAIVKDYRDSNYVPYALLADAGTDSAYLAQVLEAIDRFPESPVRDLLFMKAFSVSSGNGRNTPGAWKIHERAEAALHASKRATVRAMAFGRESLKTQ